jgi:hypothetical protein
MGFLGAYLLGILSGVFIKVVGEILSPTVAELGAKLHAKVWRKPYIRGQLAQDIETLEAITTPLLHLHAIPRYPDSYKKTSEWLLDIDTKARKLRHKSFQDIRDKLLEYTTPMNQVSVNVGLTKVLDLFVKDEKAFKLMEEIRELISKATKEKKTK